MINTDGGPAFPIHVKDISGGFVGYNGMSLRDHFAATCPVTFDEFIKIFGLLDACAPSFITIQRYANFRMEYADAMLAAREVK